MKHFSKYLTIALLSLLLLLLYNCSNDDNNSKDQNPLLGKWEAVSGSLLDGFIPNYIIFNNDSIGNLLFETELGFKHNFETEYSVSESEVTFNLQGNIAYQYTLDGETLTLTDQGSNIAQFQKNNNAPEVNEWIQELSILSQGNAPWEGVVDIAFTYDKTQIVYGMNSTTTYIALINPENFEEVGQIPAENRASVVEIEKYFGPDRYLFQSSGNSDLINYYTMNDGMYNDSIEIATEISGLASINATQIWISNNYDTNLYLYNYGNDTIENQIDINITTYGLDYQNTFLYISNGLNLFKCQTSPEFKVVESYYIPDTDIYGIAYDGNNFWVSGNTNDGFKLIKTNLTL